MRCQLSSLHSSAGRSKRCLWRADQNIFLDVLGDTMADGFEQLPANSPGLVRSELERVYGEVPAPRWIRGLHAGDETAWRTLHRAQQAAYETVLAPVWSVVQDLHRGEFTRYALTVAEHGVAATLAGLARAAGSVRACGNGPAQRRTATCASAGAAWFCCPPSTTRRAHFFRTPRAIPRS
ncbi:MULTISPECIES: hypothetical protein [Streptomyces]|uniref:hypothetical protein n=1 Tax=Streptomyces TaxID=1883 RepID=UPI000B1E41DA